MTLEERLKKVAEELEEIAGEMSPTTVSRAAAPRILDTVSRIVESCESIEEFFEGEERDDEFFEKD